MWVSLILVGLGESYGGGFNVLGIAILRGLELEKLRKNGCCLKWIGGGRC